MSKTMTWHISSSGKPARCRAFLRTCPRTHFTTNDKGRVVDNPNNVDTGSSSYGSFTPEPFPQERLQDEVSLNKAVEEKNFNSFVELSDNKKKKQNKASSQQVVQFDTADGPLRDVKFQEIQTVLPLARQKRKETETLKLKIQSRLQNPDWDEHSAELVSMYYAKVIEKSKVRKNESDPTESINAAYEESYSMNMISSMMNQAEYNSQGKLALNEKKIEKMIEMRSDLCNKAYQTEKQETTERSRYGGFFESNRVPRDVAGTFKAVANKNAIENIEELTTQSYDDENWGTYRAQVTLQDVTNI